MKRSTGKQKGITIMLTIVFVLYSVFALVEEKKHIYWPILLWFIMITVSMGIKVYRLVRLYKSSDPDTSFSNMVTESIVFLVFTVGWIMLFCYGRYISLP